MDKKRKGPISMKSSCMIISGGDFAPLPVPGPDTFVIACDRGYAYARRCGIRPDLLVSDFDSFRGEVDPGIPVRRFPSEKDDTDTVIALRAAAEMGFSEAALYCALGGRLDHTLANLQAAVWAERHGLRLRILSPDTEIYTLSSASLTLPQREGFSLSVFAAEDRCRGVTIRGAKYPLRDAELSSSFPLGVSNEWAGDAAEISVRDGTLLIVLSRL